MTLQRQAVGKLKNGTIIYRTWSDANLMLIQVPTGIKYVDALDPENTKYTYVESDEPIPEQPEEPTRA